MSSLGNERADFLFKLNRKLCHNQVNAFKSGTLNEKYQKRTNEEIEHGHGMKKKTKYQKNDKRMTTSF